MRVMQSEMFSGAAHPGLGILKAPAQLAKPPCGPINLPVPPRFWGSLWK
jgi:hypothetical protein